jgi:hypothetical protein
MLTVSEAMYLVHERVASAEDVDKLFKGCFGHKASTGATSAGRSGPRAPRSGRPRSHYSRTPGSVVPGLF